MWLRPSLGCVEWRKEARAEEGGADAALNVGRDRPRLLTASSVPAYMEDCKVQDIKYCNSMAHVHIKAKHVGELKVQGCALLNVFTT